MFTVVLFELTGEKSYMGLSDNFENSSSYLLRESIVKSTTSRPFNPCGNNLSIDIMDREVKVTRIYLVSFCVIVYEPIFFTYTTFKEICFPFVFGS